MANLYMVFDSETCNGVMIDGKLCLDYSLAYDTGWAIVDAMGNVIVERSFVVKEIFFGEAELMKEAFFADKIPQYLREIAEGKRKVATLYEIRKQLREDCEKYNIRAICAHNARFDLNALNMTQRWLTKSKYRYFFPYGLPIWDTLTMSRNVIAKRPDYVEFCEAHGYMTKHRVPQVKLTAEVIYRYLTNDDSFIESHTGLEDVLIEKDIFAECMKHI